MKPLSEKELKNDIAVEVLEAASQAKYGVSYLLLDKQQQKHLAVDCSESCQKLLALILQDRKAWGEQEHRAGYVRGISDFSGWYMDASIPAQRVPIMPDIAKDLIDSYAPPTYTEQMFECQRNQGEKTDED